MRNDIVQEWAFKLASFKSEANIFFAQRETSQSRAYTLDQSYNDLNGLNIKQDDLFRQSLRCVEVGVFRAAHVMAWAGLVDCLHTLAASDQFSRLNTARPNWTINSIEKLRDDHGEFNQIEAFFVAGLITKTEKKALHGMLSKRNECAHPADYFPTFNETLGYISEAFQRLAAIEKRFPQFVIF
jgi:hypothetical protein